MKIYFKIINEFYESVEIKNVSLYLNFNGDWKSNKYQKAAVLQNIFKMNQDVFKNYNFYPLTVEIYLSNGLTSSLFVGEIYEQKYFEFREKI